MPDLSNIDQLLTSGYQRDITRPTLFVVVGDQLAAIAGFYVIPGITPNTMILIYDGIIAAASSNPSSYTVSGPATITITAVSIDKPHGRITLTYSGVFQEGNYVISVSGVLIEGKTVATITSYTTNVVDSNNFNTPVN